MKTNMSKITFLGDIVCDKPLLRAAKHDENYCFDEMFEDLKPLFSSSDYVVGALETTFSGGEKGFNSRSFAYNSPDELAKSIQNCGINVLTLANNHCLDYGIGGLERTVHILNELSILNTGAKESGTGYLILQCGATKVAILSYTAVLNSKPGAKAISTKEKRAVNFITEVNPPLTVSLLAKRLLPSRIRESLKRIYYKNKVKNNIPTIKAVVDNENLTERDEPYIKEFVEVVKEARQKADIVIACIHCGGQFNSIPGKRTRQLYERIAPNVDIIIGNHPHVIQAIEFDSSAIMAYSLGTMNLSLSADYITFDNLPQYSLAFHLYIDDSKHCVDRITYTILHTEEDASGYVKVVPLKDWFEKQYPNGSEEIMDEINQIHATVMTGKKVTGCEIKNEYDLRG